MAGPREIIPQAPDLGRAQWVAADPSVQPFSCAVFSLNGAVDQSATLGSLRGSRTGRGVNERGEEGLVMSAAAFPLDKGLQQGKRQDPVWGCRVEILEDGIQCSPTLTRA